MKQIFLCLTVALLVCAAVAAGTTLAYDPLFWIEKGQTTQLNMTITQWDETTDSWEVPADSVYYLESPVNFMVKYPGGANATNTTINITGPGATHPELTTNATGQANYTFDYTAITQGGQQIVVKAIEPGSAYARKIIYVDYQGILEVSVRTDSMVIDPDYGDYWDSDADMYYTVVVLDSATAIYFSMQIPEWTKEFEAEHASKVLQDFAKLGSHVDMATLSEDPTASAACPIGMAPESVSLVGIHASGGTLRFNSKNETFACEARTPAEIPLIGNDSWNSTPADFLTYDKFYVDTFPEEGAKLQLETGEDRIYNSSGEESLSGEFRSNNFTVTNSTTLTTHWLTIHAKNITIGPNSSIIADGGGLFGGKYDEDGKGVGRGYNSGNYSTGGGGAGYGGEGGDGGTSRYGDGGQGGSAYGNETNISVDSGSGGAGGACGQYIQGVGRYVGGKGGEGGGAIFLDAPIINISGIVSANGDDGRKGSNASDSAGGGGGGGSGGTILLKGGNISIYGNLSAKGGNGGDGGIALYNGYNPPSTENNGGGGGGGAGGRIKIFYGISFSAPSGLASHTNVNDGAGGLGGVGGVGVPGGNGSAGENGTVYNESIDYTESIPHYPRGWLISNLTKVQGHIGYNTGSAMVRYGTMTWNEIPLSGTNIAMKVWTSMDANMSDAMSWESCPEVTNGQDISDLSSVSNGHRYIQWRAEFVTWDRSRTPVLKSVNISYEYGLPILVNSSGGIEFSSQYLYLPNYKLVYAHGATIKHQETGEFILHAPPISICKQGNITKLEINSINLTGGGPPVSGVFSSTVKASYQDSTLLKGGLNFYNLTINITTSYPTAWKNWLNDTCKEAGLEYGTDPGSYYITETGNTVQVIFYGNESRPVNVWLKSAEAKIKIEK